MSQSQQNNNTEAHAASARAWKIRWVVGGLLLLFAAAAAMNLPRGYSDDLSRIGKGNAAVVLIRDKNAVPSFDLIRVLDSVRDKYAGKVEFLLTDFDTTEGRAFIAANHAAPVTLVLFDAGGKPVKVLHAPQTAENVQQEIAGALGVDPR
jgi:hypothetical protein